ncbi:MAG: alpha/beta hydrolase [Piscinibacter sp.]|uniref:alpha/beta fold hydrolase n=1 Tax=Piscinibacter TaxID=1114981 RepID=UPI000FDDC133|nr:MULTISPECIES: alpha/beta hydrolase [Piscinibacter]MCW5665301.1 alpha/beta hydrolase [Piscinibacter sp.]
MTPWFEGFEAAAHAVNGTTICARTGGPEGAPPLLLVHGFPQTHVLWHRVARQLAQHHRLVLPDLRGYGDSAKPRGEADHANYSKRVMAADLLALMRSLGHERFFVAGHDRGARVAHRLALDAPQAVARLALIDIAPTLDMYGRTDMAFARAYYHWFHLIQPSPLPETMIGGNARFYLHWHLGGWGAQGLGHLEPEALAEYERCFCRPEAIHAACEDYRASAGIDLEHDRASRAAGQKIECDTLLLWGERGVIARLFEPLALWQAQCAGTVSGRAVPAGHFIPEELPDETAAELRDFFR